MDVTLAYLYGPVDADIYLTKPEGLEEIMKDPLPKNPVCKLQKSLYGLKQSGHIWNQTLVKSLKGWGFVQLKTDPCLFTRRVDNRKIVLAIYVDDILIGYKSKYDLEWFLKRMKAEYQFKNLGPVKQCLSLDIKKTDHGNYVIHQAPYIQRLMQKHGLYANKKAMSPLVPRKNWYSDETPKVDPTMYRAKIGSILYVALGTRPDISHAVSFLARFSQEPRQMHMDAANRLIQYLYNTIEYKLKYSSGKIATEVFVDASHATCPVTMRSTTGYYVSCYGAPVVWRSKRQSHVAKSTATAEYIAMSEAVDDVTFTRQLLIELGCKEIEPTIMHEDSEPAIKIATKPGFTQRSKTIMVCYHSIREAVEDGRIRITSIRGKLQPADILTKPLSRGGARKCAKRIFSL